MKRHHSKFSSGFTLIELLVVIAIIGILSAVVLASLNSARAKGADAAVKSDLDGIRDQAEIYNGDQVPNSYGSAFGPAACPASGDASMFGDPKISSAILNAATVAGVALPQTLCTTDGANYAVLVPLKTANYWCIDSSGKSAMVTTNTFVGQACPAS
jgi:prepilin-type N-terminal cleavage/methylation domain-containing protein